MFFVQYILTAYISTTKTQKSNNKKSMSKIIFRFHDEGIVTEDNQVC